MSPYKWYVCFVRRHQTVCLNAKSSVLKGSKHCHQGINASTFHGQQETMNL